MNATDAIAFLPTADLESTRRFYVDQLGLTLRLDQGACHIYQAAPNAHFGFCTTLTPHQNPDQIILTLVTENVQDFYQNILNQNIQTDGPPRENLKFKIFHFFMTDPNGYRVEVQHFLEDWYESDEDQNQLKV